VRALRNTEHLAKETRTHYVVWFSCVAGCLAFSYVVASAVPFFGGLLGLASALFGTLLVIGAEVSTLVPPPRCSRRPRVSSRAPSS